MTLCVSCQLEESVVDIRKRLLCADCFVHYVNSKVRKRMESYRFKNLTVEQKKRLLLPLSGGVSSLSLLQILDAQLREQISKQNRTAYELVVVHVDLLETDQAVSASWYQETESRFVLHEYLPIVKVHEVLRIDEDLESALALLELNRKAEIDDQHFYSTIMSSTTSVTTRADLRELLVRRLLVSLAKQHSCDSILWGHSDSRLASQALADVAKGRGASVPGTLADGPSPEGINFSYPMRDLFKTELELYGTTLSSPLHPLASSRETEHVVSLRNTSIDNLLSTYITSQGEKYPSIMANVVRTASKLQPPSHKFDSTYCAVCRCAMNVEGHAESLCYGCQRMKQDIKLQD